MRLKGFYPVAGVTVRARCPQCGQQNDALAHHYQIWVCANRPGRNFYTFTCRNCGAANAEYCTPLIEQLMAASGVAKRIYQLPDEMDDPQRNSREPLSVDDLLDLMNDVGGDAA